MERAAVLGVALGLLSACSFPGEKDLRDKSSIETRRYAKQYLALADCTYKQLQAADFYYPPNFWRPAEHYVELAHDIGRGSLFYLVTFREASPTETEVELVARRFVNP